MLYREWTVKRPEPQKSALLMAEAGTGRLLSDVLVSRGYDTPEAALALLAEEGEISDPFLLEDMDKAVETIHAAIAAEQPMVIFGDYDVDGITATALLYSSLVSLGAQVYYKLANRQDDGYGLSARIVDDIADRGIGLIITVDNGISALEAAARAAERGVTLVITDHHLPLETLPQAAALVDPCRPGDESPFKNFSGAGVAFLLACALEECSPAELLEVFGDLAAIGTIADVMQLTGENRILVRESLRAVQNTERPGLAALLEACGYGGKEITSETVSFGLAPRLNAAGRMGDATDALRLLLAEDEEEAALLAEHLCAQNTARQTAESQIMDDITAQLEADPKLARSRVLVVWGKGWHQGVIGIVANRLVDRYGKPSVVISLDGEEGRGSGRSVQGVSLHAAISSCADILIRYGGHDVAAGLSLEPAHVEQFRQRLNAWAAENCPVLPAPEQLADAPVALAQLSVEEVQALGRLSPCGSGNPAPRFVVENAVLDAVYPISEGKHLRVRLKQGPANVYAVLFGTGPAQLAYTVGDRVDAMLTLSVYEGKAGPMVSARLLEMRPAGLTNKHVRHCALFEGFYAGLRCQPEQKVYLKPSREDTAKVYRAIREGALCFNDLRPLFAKEGEDAAGRLLCALAALEELGLIERDEATCRYSIVPVTEKRPLESSGILQRLEA